MVWAWLQCSDVEIQLENSFAGSQEEEATTWEISRFVHNRSLGRPPEDVEVRDPVPTRGGCGGRLDRRVSSGSVREDVGSFGMGEENTDKPVRWQVCSNM